MPEARTLTTERLVLRPWRDEDLAPFAALNADLEVMEHFPAPLTRSESDAFAAGIRQRMAAEGWGLWAVEVTEGDARGFIGFVGLARPRFEAHFTPAVEIGWRLARSAWGRGYATEGARRAAAFAFEELDLDELVALTAVSNVRSQAVARRLGMTRDPRDDFDHPSLPSSSNLKRHQLFRLRKPPAERSSSR